MCGVSIFAIIGERFPIISVEIYNRRGFFTLAYSLYRYLKENAIIIQKTFRGYLGRKWFREYAKVLKMLCNYFSQAHSQFIYCPSLLQKHFETVQRNYYDSMATKVNINPHQAQTHSSLCSDFLI